MKILKNWNKFCNNYFIFTKITPYYKMKKKKMWTYKNNK